MSAFQWWNPQSTRAIYMCWRLEAQSPEYFQSPAFLVNGADKSWALCRPIKVLTRGLKKEQVTQV